MYPFPDPRSENPLNPSEPDNNMNIGSSGDCTGLIPTAVKTDEEEDNYSELYDFLPRAIKINGKGER